MSKKVLGGMGVAGVAMFGFWSTIAMPVCSCIPAGDGLELRIGAHPVRDDPEVVRRAFLVAMPAGTPEDDLMTLLRRTNHSLDRCEKSGERTLCRINFRVNFWGTTGYEMDFRFDVTRRLQDVRFERF